MALALSVLTHPTVGTAQSAKPIPNTFFSILPKGKAASKFILHAEVSSANFLRSAWVGDFQYNPKALETIKAMDPGHRIVREQRTYALAGTSTEEKIYYFVQPFIKYRLCTLRINEDTYEPLMPNPAGMIRLTGESGEKIDETIIEPALKKRMTAIGTFEWDNHNGVACYLPFGQKFIRWDSSMENAFASDEHTGNMLIATYITIPTILGLGAGALVGRAAVGTMLAYEAETVAIGTSQVLPRIIMSSTAVYYSGTIADQTRRASEAYLLWLDELGIKNDSAFTDYPKAADALKTLVSALENNKEKYWSPSYYFDLSDETKIATIDGSKAEKNNPYLQLPLNADMIKYVSLLKSSTSDANRVHQSTINSSMPDHVEFWWDTPFRK